MDVKIISLVLIIICIIWLYFEMKKISQKKETFVEDNIYFTREEPYNFSNLLSTLNELKEKTTEYSSILQNLQIEKLAKSYEKSSNKALDDAVEKS